MVNSGMFPACISQRRVRGQHPELNPVERVWLFLRERFLSFRVLDDQEAVINACCDAWNALAAETGRCKSPCSYPWITNISS
jgi:hypothetical protein